METQRLREIKKVAQGHKTSQTEELGFVAPQCPLKSLASRVYSLRTQVGLALNLWS